MLSTIHRLEAIAFLDLLAVAMIVPLISGHVHDLGGSHMQIGLLGSIYSGFQLFSGPVVGSLSDLKGRKSVILVTTLLCGICYIILGLTSSITVILILRAFLGVFKQTQLLTKALIPEYEKNEASQSVIYGQMAAISGMGMTLGPIIGGHIVEDVPEHGFAYVGLLVGILFILNCAMIYYLPLTKVLKRGTQVARRDPLNYITSSLKESVSDLFKVDWNAYWEIFLLKALCGFAMGVYYSNYSLFLKAEYNLSPKYIGYVISFQGVIGSVSSFFIGYINKLYTEDHDYSQRNLHVCMLLLFSTMGIICSNSILTYLLFIIPLAVGNATGRLVLLEMILKKSESVHRGKFIGATNSVRSLSGVVSPMVAGFISQYCGVSYAIYASFTSLAISCVISYKIRIKSTYNHKTE